MPQRSLFFASSHGLTDRLGEIFNFTWSNVVAMWNLREQVKDFCLKSGNSRQDELHEHFVKPVGVTSADLQTTCLRWSWKEHRQQFAKVLLFDLCSMFESWLEVVVPIALPATASENTISKVQKGLQFPTKHDAGKTTGLQAAIVEVNKHKSPLTTQDFFPVLKKHPKNAWPLIEDMLVAYRYFKGCRNVLIHAGGIADTDLVNHRQLLSQIDPKQIGLHGKLQLPMIAVNKPIVIEIADVVALSSILHSIIITFDAALSVGIGCESYLIERIRKSLTKGRTLPTKDPSHRIKAILRLVRRARFPEPSNTTRLETALITKNVIMAS